MFVRTHRERKRVATASLLHVHICMLDEVGIRSRTEPCRTPACHTRSTYRCTPQAGRVANVPMASRLA